MLTFDFDLRSYFSFTARPFELHNSLTAGFEIGAINNILLCPQVALPMLDQAVKIETMVDTGGPTAWFQPNASPAGPAGCVLPTPAGSPKVSEEGFCFLPGLPIINLTILIIEHNDKDGDS